MTSLTFITSLKALSRYSLMLRYSDIRIGARKIEPPKYSGHSRIIFICLKNQVLRYQNFTNQHKITPSFVFIGMIKL